MVRVERIELSSRVWKTRILPMNYTRLVLFPWNTVIITEMATD